MVNNFPFVNDPLGFDVHISKSIRGLEDLYTDIISLSKYFIEEETTVYDLGCSTGNFLAKLAINNRETPSVSYLGLDSCKEFETCKDRKKTLDMLMYTECKGVFFENADITKYGYSDASFITSLFTLQFISQKQKLPLLKRIYGDMRLGGAFVIAEKLLYEDGRVDHMFNNLYKEWKRKNFTAEEILNKEVALKSIMRCNTEEELCSMIQEAGFDKIEPLWQNHMFTAYVCIK
jgi:tRNA (cmo5U34)-methyltransferase